MQSNVDPAEIAKFEALASRWWDPESDFKPLHDLNPVRMGYIDSYINVAGLKVLDIGCGGGILSETLARRGANVTGIDMTDAPLQVAKLHALDAGVENIEYRQMTAEDLAAEAPASFDVITCMEMLEHVPKPGDILKACHTLLKPGGKAFFSTINRNPKSWLFAIAGAEYVLQLLPKGTHSYEKFIKPSELTRYARRAELSITNLRGINYNPITKGFKLTDDVSVNYLMATEKDKQQ
ncbi:bifunctional 2-polyprenyl-6-hydroxyphenol methylase/3-demethylubiquinol 3-O-methyltransferase UbiG [Reinekea marinisedimentorum]|uniref:Ubiquinone biosynthesis O-methyltransferase n=1 Tax=Reinekea marinisedimentorum TaxID=230495 RepID=A0A4R3I2U9_9GAMM|nr:bifunctional 2-polyprenyl-6-hydroxyphenol methylase/3-demethylubiquinol 3-O-methyltransferase UbiG [Reinekea marinisedimentorum]TCS39988.1 2-polyprenyl-6-hydroxyphenyl methylase/3-demethylubiquinone-9 3-methyltransferase [Reinekea marinisedimentorum]